MNAREFEVSETRYFITLTDRDSKRAFRIAVADALLLGTFAAEKWRTGDVVKLSAAQQEILAKLDARCREIGDEAAIREYKGQNKYGGMAWIMVIAAIIVLILLRHRLGWLTWIAIPAVVIAPVAILLIAFCVTSWFKKK